MAISIKVQDQTQLRLKQAIELYVREKKLPSELVDKFSYDFIINQLLDHAEIPQ